MTNKTAFYKKLYYHQTSCKICVISVPKLTFDIFYLLEAGVFEMDNNLWIIISSERKWNLKHDERFFSFFSNDASISLSMLWVSRRKLYNPARKQIENKYLASVVMYPLTLPKEYFFLIKSRFMNKLVSRQRSVTCPTEILEDQILRTFWLYSYSDTNPGDFCAINDPSST